MLGFLLFVYFLGFCLLEKLTSVFYYQIMGVLWQNCWVPHQLQNCWIFENNKPKPLFSIFDVPALMSPLVVFSTLFFIYNILFIFPQYLNFPAKFIFYFTVSLILLIFINNFDFLRCRLSFPCLGLSSLL